MAGTANRVVGLVVLLLGIWAAIGARRLPGEAEFGLGAAFLPFWLGVVLALLGAGLLVRIAGRPAEQDGPTWPADAPAWRRLGATLTLLVAYVAFLDGLGYVAATFLFLLLAMLVLDRARWWAVGLISGLSTGALVAIFRGWLKAPLPRGPWGF
jgi:putative tricarboxylic transport membrane protein